MNLDICNIVLKTPVTYKASHQIIAYTSSDLFITKWFSLIWRKNWGSERLSNLLHGHITQMWWNQYPKTHDLLSLVLLASFLCIISRKCVLWDSPLGFWVGYQIQDCSWCSQREGGRERSFCLLVSSSKRQAVVQQSQLGMPGCGYEMGRRTHTLAWVTFLK